MARMYPLTRPMIPQARTLTKTRHKMPIAKVNKQQSVFNGRDPPGLLQFPRRRYIKFHFVSTRSGQQASLLTKRVVGAEALEPPSTIEETVRQDER